MRKLEVDRAVFYGILTRIWQIFAGPFTAILIATKFSPELQGYYYTFGSLLALQVFVQLGLGTVIIQFASHEWSKLSIHETGKIVGDNEALSRMVSLAQIALKWYATAGIITFFGLGLGGNYFFSIKTDLSVNINWTAQWWSLCFLTGLTIFLVPIWSLLEGCNQVANVYKYRFMEGLVKSLLVWVAILAGAKLWIPTISSIAGLIWAILFLHKKYWKFLKTLLFSKPIGSKFDWRLDILPMQWRIAVSWLSGYFVFSMFTPVLFQYHGAVLAGQMGMTWSLISVLSSVSNNWVKPKAPYFGILIAQKKYEQLDNLFRRLVIIVSTVAGIGALSIWILVFSLNKIHFPLIDRILPPLPLALFLMATFTQTISIPFSIYLRAHKEEPAMVLSVVSAILICTSNLTFGKYYSVTGMATGYLLINILIIPFLLRIWYQCRAKWHGSY